MATLSVNINKIATLRNARGKQRPNLVEMTKKIIACGITSITVHPRPDERHITLADVWDLHQLLSNYPEAVEFNIEGFPTDSFLSLISKVRPQQCTLVPDSPDALTSNAGWNIFAHEELLSSVLQRLPLTTRSSLFINPFDYLGKEDKTIACLKRIGTHRIELYTEAYADAYGTPQQNDVVSVYKNFAQQCVENSIGVNAGHDLDAVNVAFFLKQLPWTAEVSIGHALISDALACGLAQTIHTYQHALGAKE